MNSNVSHWLKVVSGLFLLACLLPGTAAAKSTPAKLSVEYVYALDGTLSGRVVNGRVQNFEYDRRGQLLAVRDARGNDLERYVYDPAGNILSKTVHGRTTRFTYDAANQITSRTNSDGSVVRYQYDAAGRLVREGNRTYHYGWQDKVEEIRENGKTVARFTYGLDGQLESVTRADGSVEHFYWDGLALIGRGKSTFLNEPYVTGGNPIASDGKSMLNDMLGSTVGIRDGEKMTPVAMTAFGESADPEAMYTGKPHVDGLGYAFLFRNYRASLGKWQTADPLGYPDGWNQLAYVNNGAVYAIDWLGASGTLIIHASASGEPGSSNTSGHSWISYTPDATGITTTYGTWGNKTPKGLHENLEAQYEAQGNYKDKATRRVHLTDAQEAALMAEIQKYRNMGEDAWGYTEPCSDFATAAWEAGSGEDLSSGWLWTTPSELKEKIIKANGGIQNGVKE